MTAGPDLIDTSGTPSGPDSTTRSTSLGPDTTAGPSLPAGSSLPTGPSTTTASDVTSAALAWSYNPWRERPGTAFGAVAGLAVMALLMFWARLWVGPFLVLLIAINSQIGSALWPQRFRLDSEGAHYGRARLAWTAIPKATLRKDGLLIYRRKRPSWLASFDAIFMPFPTSLRQRLADQARPLIEAHGL